MPDQFDAVIRRVKQVTGMEPVGAGRGRVKALCPAHADEKPSLSIRKSPDETKVWVRCHAGCSFEEVLEELELTPRDLVLKGGRRGSQSPTTAAEAATPSGRESNSRRRKAAPLGKEVARYPYRDEDGTVLYYNIRFEPKDFRLADRHGEPKSMPKNMRWVPYNLPEVIAAVERGQTVYWVEGEKDADRLKAEGEVATTNAGGANRPLDPEWAQYFEGAHVVVVGDKDKPGRSYARAVARLLINTANRVDIREAATPQAKSDVSDHLNAGYGLVQLDPVPMRSVRRTRWTVQQIMETRPEELRWVLPNLIPEGLTLLVGAPKVGKSWWNINLMAALGSGRPKDVFDFGEQIDPSPNLYLALEDPHRRIYSRMRQVTRGLQFPRHLAGAVWLDLPQIDKGGKDEIERWLEAHPNARAVLVDVLAKVRGGGDEHGGMYQADYAAVSILKEIADDYGIGVVVTHHDRKKTDDDFMNMVSGTKGVTGAADTVLYLTRERGSTSGLMRVESRDVESHQWTLEFVKESGRWHFVDRQELGQEPDTPRADLLTEIERVVAVQGSMKVPRIAGILNRSPEEIEKALIQGRERGSLAEGRDGWYVPKF